MHVCVSLCRRGPPLSADAQRPPRYALTSPSLCECIFTFSVCCSHPPSSVCVSLWLQQGLVLALYICLTGAGGGAEIGREGWMGCTGWQRFVFCAIFIVSHRPDYIGHRPSRVTYGAAGARAACLHCAATESTKKGPSSQLGGTATAGGAAQPYCSTGDY